MSEEPGAEKQKRTQELESLRSEIREYYKGAEMGTPKFMALSDEIQLSEGLTDFENEREHIVKVESEEANSRRTIVVEAHFQLAASRMASIEQTISQRRSEVEGYRAEEVKAVSFAKRLIDLNTPEDLPGGARIPEHAVNGALNFLMDIRDARYSEDYFSLWPPKRFLRAFIILPWKEGSFCESARAFIDSSITFVLIPSFLATSRVHLVSLFAKPTAPPEPAEPETLSSCPRIFQMLLTSNRRVETQ